MSDFYLLLREILRYYVVRKGKKTGIFTSRNEVKPLVSGFPDAKYKSFSSLQQAKEALQQGREPFYQEKQKPSFRKSRDEMTEIPFVRASIAVDAACSGNPGLLEYRGVDLQTGEEIFHQRFDLGTNNIGEFLAIVHGASYLHQMKTEKALYSDSKIAMNWVREGKCKSLLKAKQPTLDIWQTVKKAEMWLQRHKITIPLLKWKTEDWGEIPADFGRK